MFTGGLACDRRTSRDERLGATVVRDIVNSWSPVHRARKFYSKLMLEVLSYQIVHPKIGPTIEKIAFNSLQVYHRLRTFRVCFRKLITPSHFHGT